MSESQIQGVVACYMLENRVVASTTEFSDRTPPAGYSKRENQERIAVDRLARVVIETYSVPMFANALSDYYCRKIMHALPGRVDVIEVGYDDESAP